MSGMRADEAGSPLPPLRSSSVLLQRPVSCAAARCTTRGLNLNAGGHAERTARFNKPFLFSGWVSHSGFGLKLI